MPGSGRGSGWDMTKVFNRLEKVFSRLSLLPSPKSRTQRLSGQDEGDSGTVLLRYIGGNPISARSAFSRPARQLSARRPGADDVAGCDGDVSAARLLSLEG